MRSLIYSLVLLALVGCSTTTSNQPTNNQQQQEEKKFGYTEDERNQIFDEIVSAERAAQKEADEVYPVVSDENMEMNIELRDKYKLGIQEKYGISEDIRLKIEFEGVQKGWLIP